ncbi:reversion-inducing cysteine-rich protein with Kazal motifs-like [Lineus longissimus]|uniref:reversion-inducing cysteine-rich protein with Kazal motifs-like n=1 Tax=Lineus longissimus TaxID=88925 RepID=UPI00315CF119
MQDTLMIQRQKLAEVAQDCPSRMTALFQCLHQQYPGARPLAGWPGKLCCPLALQTSCEQSCEGASSKTDIRAVCHKTREASLHHCIAKQEEVKCCNVAPTDPCRWLCHSLILDDQGVSWDQKQAIRHHCQEKFTNILTCVQNHTKTEKNPMEGLPCCEKADTPTCKETCKRVLDTKTTEREIVDELMVGCGQPEVMTLSPMWACFLSNSGKQKTEEEPARALGMDGAKLHCCSKAVTSACRESCVKTYSKVWHNNWKEYSDNCHQSEVALRMCLSEVDEPCKMGCSGLKYCSNFNHRPTDMFRSCSLNADKSAREWVKKWEQGSISAMTQVDVSSVDVSKCHPDVWKAIACALAIKPCHRKSHSTSICKSSCIELLEQCVKDDEKVDGASATVLCNLLTPNDEGVEPCVSLYDYLEPSPYRYNVAEVTRPCVPNPCNGTDVCVINRRHCKHPQICPAYVCKPSCPLGELSTLHIPLGSHVLVPLGSNMQNCHRVCRCGRDHTLDHCVSLPCPELKQCSLPSGQTTAHNTILTFGCNKCICHHGKMLCSSRDCHGLKSGPGRKYPSTGLPCNCTTEYLPVCSKNGRTYPSACLARCLQLRDSQMKSGECLLNNPCSPNPCQSNERCFPRRQTCLSADAGDCKQYECVEDHGRCKRHHDPVCDTEGLEHVNLCSLVAKGKKLAYRGHCRPGCRTHGTVCAHNGETYPSECEALGNGVTIDYDGPCITVGQYSAAKGQYSCRKVRCHKKRHSACHGVVPPGGCCPVCGGIIRILFSNKLAVTVASTARVPPISVQNVTQQLRQHLVVAECDVFGYLSIENELVVTVVPVSMTPTALQVEACVSEAENLGSLFKLSSPMLTLDVSLYPFLTTTVHTSQAAQASSAAILSSSRIALMTFIQIIICLWWR